MHERDVVMVKQTQSAIMILISTEILQRFKKKIKQSIIKCSRKMSCDVMSFFSNSTVMRVNRNLAQHGPHNYFVNNYAQSNASF